MPFSRRSFLQLSSLVGGGLLLGFSLEQESKAEAAHSPAFAPNAWLRIETGGRIVFILDRNEMGQGVYTALPMILAEELAVKLEDLVIEMAPADRVYVNPQLAGLQMTGGSTSISASYVSLREAGAAARTLLAEAAAKRWGVAASACRASQGRILHPSTQESFSYGELAQEASKLPLPDKIVLKEARDFTLIGKSTPRLDSRLKITGKAGFGIDVNIPDLRNAVYIRSPVLGAKIKRWDGSKAKASIGVEDVLQMGEGIVVVALRYWQARKAAEQLDVEWEGGSKQMSSSGIFADFAVSGRENIEEQVKDSKVLRDASSKVIAAEYQVPYAAHAALEPINCTARVSENLCEVWAPTQSPGVAQQVAHEISGVPLENVKIHSTFIGGGFGRRLFQDYVAQAVNIALLVKKPIKLLWSREEDFQHDFYRPASFHAIRAAVDAKGQALSWRHSITGPSILSETLPTWIPTILPPWVPDFIKQGTAVTVGSMMRLFPKDPSSVEGAKDMPYEIPELEVDYQRLDPGVPVGFWRSVGHSYTGFVVETMIDELAQLAAKDPFEFRQGLLTKSPRHLRVLSELAQKASWQQPPAEGLFRGLALHASFGSVCGQVAEIRVDLGSRSIKVERVVAVVDCGRVINPASAEVQVSGAIIFGLSGCMTAELSFKDGALEQSNFHDHPVLRYEQCPRIEVSFIESEEKPSGLGEPGVPPIAAALANAIFAATGKRLRSFPLKI